MEEQSNESSEDEEGEEAKKAAERWARVRGLTGPQSSSASSSEEDSDSDELAEGSQSSAEEVGLSCDQQSSSFFKGSPYSTFLEGTMIAHPLAKNAYS